MTFLDEAIDLARRGWPVFPVKADKKPYTKNGFKDASRDEATIVELWKGRPIAGIGLPTGPESGVWVLDVDPQKGGLEALQALEQQFGALETVKSQTGGGGFHFFFKWPGDRVVKNSVEKIGPGLDVRGRGGYVVVPPSPWMKDGVTSSYKWIRAPTEAPVVDAPEWLLERVATDDEPLAEVIDLNKKRERATENLSGVKFPGAYARKALAEEIERVSNTTEGSRNSTLNDAAFRLAALINAGFIARWRVEDGLQEAGEQTGLTPDEVRKTIASGLGDAMEPTDPLLQDPPSDGEPPKDDGGSGGSSGDDGPISLYSTDPLLIAQKFIELRYRINDTLTLHRWREEWWEYKDGLYVHIPREILRSQVHSFTFRCQKIGADGSAKPIGTGKARTDAVLDLMSAAKLETIIDPRAQPPIKVNSGLRLEPNRTICKNGVLNLETQELEAATPDLFSVTSVDAEWDPQVGRPPEWTNFLESLFGGDYEAVELLQEWFGYCLTSDTSQQKLMLLIGPKRSGKGTIARVLTGLLGSEACISPTLESLASGFGLAPWIGKTLSVFADIRLSNKTDQAPLIERVLSITGEDAQTIDRKNRDQITVRLQTRIMMLMNELPRIVDASGAFVSRCMMIDLTRSFYGKEDRELEGKLRKERSGIFKWAVEGWQRLRERGFFKQPKSSEDAQRDFEILSSPISSFVEERCELRSDLEIDSGLLFEHFWKPWCRARSVREGTPGAFSSQLQAAFGIGRAKRYRPSETDLKDLDSYFGRTEPRDFRRKYKGISVRSVTPITTNPDELPFGYPSDRSRD